MKLKLILLLAFATVNFNAQHSCDFTANYLEFLTVEVKTFDDEAYIFLKPQKPSESFCFYPVFKDTMYINYLSKSLLDLKYVDEYLKGSQNQEVLNERFLSVLDKDTIFKKSLNELIGKTILGKPKDTITFNQLMNNAVKFFSIYLNEDGNYKGKICVGNERIIQNLHKVRHPQVEAFCFSSIFKHLLSKDKKYDFVDEWKTAVIDIASVSLGVDEDEMILRAQGALFLLMKNNENLQNMLLEEYELNKDVLPFYLSYQ